MLTCIWLRDVPFQCSLGRVQSYALKRVGVPDLLSQHVACMSASDGPWAMRRRARARRCSSAAARGWSSSWSWRRPPMAAAALPGWGRPAPAPSRAVPTRRRCCPLSSEALTVAVHHSAFQPDAVQTTCCRITSVAVPVQGQLIHDARIMFVSSCQNAALIVRCPSMCSSDTLAAQLGLHQGPLARPAGQPSELASGGAMSAAAAADLSIGAAPEAYAGYDRLALQSHKRQRRADSPGR